jgi:hypothetical protein
MVWFYRYIDGTKIKFSKRRPPFKDWDLMGLLKPDVICFFKPEKHE